MDDFCYEWWMIFEALSFSSSFFSKSVSGFFFELYHIFTLFLFKAPTYNAPWKKRLASVLNFLEPHVCHTSPVLPSGWSLPTNHGFLCLEDDEGLNPRWLYRWQRCDGQMVRKPHPYPLNPLDSDWKEQMFQHNKHRHNRHVLSMCLLDRSHGNPIHKVWWGLMEVHQEEAILSNHLFKLRLHNHLALVSQKWLHVYHVHHIIYLSA